VGVVTVDTTVGSPVRSAVPKLVASTRELATRGVRQAAWAWAGAPSGPLGWVSARWVMPRLHAGIYPAMAAIVQPQSSDELLEVACGSGVFLAEQAAVAQFVAGLDLSDIQVGLARQRLATRVDAGTAEIIQGDVSRLPWPDQRFTAVTCMGSFETSPEPDRALREIYRVLRPGGRAALNIGERVPPGTETHQVLGAIWVWSEDDVRAMVEAQGFASVDVRYVNYENDGWPWRLVRGPALRVVQAVA
jgi:SAM-dependent methyltransferase